MNNRITPLVLGPNHWAVRTLGASACRSIARDTFRELRAAGFSRGDARSGALEMVLEQAHSKADEVTS